MLFLQPNTANPLLDLNLSSADPNSVFFLIAGILLAALLGHACYTDIFRGKVIKNYTTGAVFLLAAVLTPFIFDNIVSHLLIVLGVYVFLFFIALLGAVKMGDIKLYAGLSLLLAQASVYMIFLSWIVIILYSIPIMYATVQRNKAAGVQAKRGQRLGSAPGGPGIVIAFYLTILALGASAAAVGGMVLVSAAVTGIFWLVERDKREAEAKAKAESDDEEKEDKTKDIKDESGFFLFS